MSVIIKDLTENVEIVQTLSTYPNQEDGLSDAELKAKFDEGAKIIKEYLNEELVPAVREIQETIDIGSQYGLDKSLTEEGRAADSKAVGDAIKSLTAEDVGARPDTWVPTAYEVGARPSDWMPTAAQVGARPDTWVPTIAEIGAAPAGYGLGGTAVRTEDWNTTYDNGFYFGITNSPDESWWYGYTVRDGADTNRITQTVYRNGIICTRTGTISDMGLWEYVNPPMAVGVEYRTAERWNGKPVYKQLINGGGLPAAGSVNIPIPSSGTIDYIISAKGSVTAQRVFPSGKVASGMSIDLETHSGGIDVYTSHDWLGGAPFYVTVEYTLV